MLRPRRQPLMPPLPTSAPAAVPGRPAGPLPLASLLRQWGLPPVAPQPLARQLGDPLAWADAIQLSQVLATPRHEVGDAASRRRALDWADAALERLQSELAAGFHDELLARESAQPLADHAPPLADLLTSYRLHLSQQQRQIAGRVTGLRERLRAHLVGASAPLARLAALDAVLERTLAAQERSALAGLATLLARRAQAHERDTPRHWPARLWADLQQLLQAELELRLQPALGLMDALRQAVAADD